MMNLNMIAKIKQLIHIHDDDTDEDYFLMAKNDEWIKLTEEEYKKQIEAKK